MRNIFEGSFTEEGTVSGKYIFEGWSKFEASEANNKFDITASSDLGAIGELPIGERSIGEPLIGERAIGERVIAGNSWRFMRNKRYSNK